jgi:Gpi18-like mannosyltransferase
VKNDKSSQYFLIWGVICLLANLFCTNAAAFGGDQNYWADWVKQLANNGLERFNGNYPPLYVFWLWIVAQVHNLANIPIEKGVLLKFFCLWPVYFGHVGLVDLASRLVARFKLPKYSAHFVLAFVALNPALLLDGPIWGQVDLFPCIF